MALLYAKSHEWYDKETGKIGISEFAANALVDIVFIDLPEIGTELSAGDTFATLESVKAVSDIYSPVTGEIVEVNEALRDAPELINQDPEAAWFVVIKATGEAEGLLDSQAYEAYCASNPEG